MPPAQPGAILMREIVVKPSSDSSSESSGVVTAASGHEHDVTGGMSSK